MAATREWAAANSISPVQPARRIETIHPDSRVPVRSEKAAPLPSAGTPPITAHPEKTAQEQKAPPMTELPLTIQQEIPAMTIQLHAYSANPTHRIVSINSRILHEGDSLMPGLVLEQITPDGVIFSYKGYRFQRGV